MDRVGKKFESHEQADAEEHRYYSAIPPNERVSILLELVSQYGGYYSATPERFERVFTVTTLEES